mmetsp:Transcript_10670/g.32815  ORF Transcript_10670/g.32815 Transcript_10670/m.32815 type:complete len:388 (+) Transcript_10670:484-1647(+)
MFPEPRRVLQRRLRRRARDAGALPGRVPAPNRLQLLELAPRSQRQTLPHVQDRAAGELRRRARQQLRLGPRVVPGGRRRRGLASEGAGEDDGLCGAVLRKRRQGRRARRRARAPRRGKGVARRRAPGRRRFRGRVKTGGGQGRQSPRNRVQRGGHVQPRRGARVEPPRLSARPRRRRGARARGRQGAQSHLRRLQRLPRRRRLLRRRQRRRDRRLVRFRADAPRGGLHVRRSVSNDDRARRLQLREPAEQPRRRGARVYRSRVQRLRDAVRRPDGGRVPRHDGIIKRRLVADGAAARGRAPVRPDDVVASPKAPPHDQERVFSSGRLAPRGRRGGRRRREQFLQEGAAGDHRVAVRQPVHAVVVEAVQGRADAGVQGPPHAYVLVPL